MLIIDEFSLEAFAKTGGRSTSRADITPKKFENGDIVMKIDPLTKKRGVNKFTIIGSKWLGRWFYEILPGVFTNGELLIRVKAKKGEQKSIPHI